MLKGYHTSNNSARFLHSTAIYNYRMRNFYGYGVCGEKQGACGVRLASPDLTYINKVTSTPIKTVEVWEFLL